jgi:gas vesicle protein
LFKQVLERRLRAEFKEEIRKEGERLHIYYNDKVREILKSQSEKMTVAEAEFIAAHEQEVKAVSDKYEEQMQEMRNHFENQISNLKLYYKMEIGNLERDALEKGKLIENVSKKTLSNKFAIIVLVPGRLLVT